MSLQRTNSSAIPLGSSLSSFNIDSCLQKWEPEAAVSSAGRALSQKSNNASEVKLEEEGTTDQMTRNTFIPLSGSVTSCAAHPLNGTTVAGTQSSSYRPDLTLEDIEKLIDDLVRETTTVWQMDEFRCRTPTTIDEAKAGVGRGCCEPFFLFILLAPTNKRLSCDVASKCEHLYQL
ncbi:hypothetical protein H6P81_013134 [Aristolochia fimbriata]|uniref:Uncharacterized protein n=1 Tax=Aristolochia fimbriata TaxID=158543 RepID=A0AAV7EF12_ARIFI|nr:hypothetical protein H6P81_013134 [Aristolochia fimbriata]